MQVDKVTFTARPELKVRKETMTTGWLNRYAFDDLNSSEALMGLLLALAFSTIFYIIAHFFDKWKKRDGAP
jgi:hypothetical protein